MKMLGFGLRRNIGVGKLYENVGIWTLKEKMEVIGLPCHIFFKVQN